MKNVNFQFFKINNVINSLMILLTLTKLKKFETQCK